MGASKKKTKEVETMTDQEAPAADAQQADAVTPEVLQQETPAAAEEGEAVWKDRYTRLMADFDNFRKRQVREREETVKRANEALICELLPVIDHLDLAFAAVSDPDDPFVTGIRIVADQLHAALAKADAKPIDATGQLFTPEQCEALGQMPSDTVPTGHVVVQVRKGWLLAGRLLRPAQVMVSSGPTASCEMNTTDDLAAE